MNELALKRVALLATHGFEEADLQRSKQVLEEAGAQVTVVGERSGNIQGWHADERGDRLHVDRSLRSVDEHEHDALVVISGLLSADRLRSNPKAVAFVRSFFQAHKPVAAIGHGLHLLVEAGVVHGRTVTSPLSIRTDLLNAGAHWMEAPVVVDEGLVTAASDHAAFERKLVEEVWEGHHPGQRP